MKKAALLSALTLTLTLTMTADDKAKAAADDQAMMAAFIKAATPAAAHAKLEDFVGTFEVKTKTWMKPGDAPLESSGVSTNAWVLGKRYVEQRYEGQFMGMPFSGIGYTGYDNIKGMYIGSWMDNMSTASMNSTGSLDADGKSFTFTGAMDDALTGKSMSMKQKIVIESRDRHTMEMWSPAPDGTVFKSMEIIYTRKK